MNSRSDRFHLKKLLIILLQLFVGGTFIFSAISKLPTLEVFGWTIVENTPLNWTISEWLARLLIGTELFLGIFFVFHFPIKKYFIPISLGLLTTFTLYLIIIWVQYGNHGNCGCFGDLLPMTPLESIIKNICLAIAIGVCKVLGSEYKFPYQRVLIAAIGTLCLAFPIWFLPPESIYIQDEEPHLKRPIPLSILYQSHINKAPSAELRKGKHIIAFMSLTCSFCRKAAIRLRIMKKKNPTLPIHLILNGDSTNLKPFFEETQATNLPFTHFNGVTEFIKMNEGTSLPSIKWVVDTTLVRESNYITLNERGILKWIKN
jgi:hypothetical protein